MNTATDKLSSVQREIIYHRFNENIVSRKSMNMQPEAIVIYELGQSCNQI